MLPMNLYMFLEIVRGKIRSIKRYKTESLP